MRRELEPLVGTHDFSGFASARDQREHTERTMEVARVSRLSEAPPVAAIDITGDGFLHNMVRIIVGTAVDVARGRVEPGAVARALASRRRDDLGVTAPPDGLYLEKLEITDEGTDRWPPPD
jgi:tRNA pseudouridine38-40 synthase